MNVTVRSEPTPFGCGSEKRKSYTSSCKLDIIVRILFSHIARHWPRRLLQGSGVLTWGRCQMLPWGPGWGGKCSQRLWPLWIHLTMLRLDQSTWETRGTSPTCEQEGLWSSTTSNVGPEPERHQSQLPQWINEDNVMLIVHMENCSPFLITAKFTSLCPCSSDLLCLIPALQKWCAVFLTLPAQQQNSADLNTTLPPPHLMWHPLWWELLCWCAGGAAVAPR